MDSLHLGFLIWVCAVLVPAAVLLSIRIARGVRGPMPTAQQFRGRCFECDYDLRGTLAAGRNACPECGAMVQRIGPTPNLRLILLAVTLIVIVGTPLFVYLMAALSRGLNLVAP